MPANPTIMSERLKGDELINALLDEVEYAAALMVEALSTNDDDPIQPYAKNRVRDAVPLAIMGIFLSLREEASHV